MFENKFRTRLQTRDLLLLRRMGCVRKAHVHDAKSGGAVAAWPLTARASRMSIRSGSDREVVTRRIDWPGRIVRSERTL
jgi:hypothetical protein